MIYQSVSKCTGRSRFIERVQRNDARLARSVRLAGGSQRAALPRAVIYTSNTVQIDLVPFGHVNLALRTKKLEYRLLPVKSSTKTTPCLVPTATFNALCEEQDIEVGLNVANNLSYVLHTFEIKSHLPILPLAPTVIAMNSVL